MKRVLVATLLTAALAAPAIAGHLVYLKEGGVIRAKSAWRSSGKVHVLVNRDTLTEFSPGEIDMKRTFPRKARKVRPATASAPRHAATPRATPTAATPAVTSAPEKKKKLSLPALPSLPSLPAAGREIPKSSEEGAIRKQKREMKERLEE